MRINELLDQYLVINTGLSHRKVLNEYRLESSALWSRRPWLLDIIDVDGGIVSFNDLSSSYGSRET